MHHVHLVGNLFNYLTLFDCVKHFYINVLNDIICLGPTPEVEYDENVMYLLLQMGFPREAIKRALFYTYNQGFESAIKWLIEHITDNNYADPFIPSRCDFNNGKDELIDFEK